jgi:presenilin-like A22 family membrane protease
MVIAMAIGTIAIFFVPKLVKEINYPRFIFVGLISYSILEIISIVIQPFLSAFYTNLVSTLVIVFVAALLVWKPEWYVIDVIAVLLGASAIASLGMSLSIELTIILLLGLLTYDFIAVYKSKHMIGLARNIMKMKLPVIMIIPTTLPYSWLTDDDPFTENSKHKAYIMGLGDLVFPGILVISVQFNLQNPILTISTIIGTMVGYAGVSYLVSKGKPQAGLPFLCSGAILGFIISSLIVYGRILL